MIGALLLLTALQTPQATPAGADVIRLRAGTELTGTIVRETADYVEIRIAEGTVVGFDKARTVAIVRSASATPPPAEAASGVRPREQWHVLHDGSGRAVGWLHGTVTRTDEGELRLGEEWRFFDAGSTTELTILEVVGADGRPASCFYHERVRADGDDRIGEERLVRAVVDGERLEVTRRSTRGNDRQVHEFPEGMRFPLESQESLRRRSAELNARVTHLLFDPRFEQFVRRTYDIGRQRRVELDGSRFTVRELIAESSTGRNAEWLDAASNSIRREINGPALVAVPSTEGEAKRQAKEHAQRFTAAFRSEPGGRFGMWLPNPMWRFVGDAPAGQLTATAELDGASVSLIAFDGLDGDLLEESAADAVWRWLRLLHPDLKLVDRAQEPVRDVRGARLRGQYEVVVEGRAELHTIEVRVFRAGDDFLALCCDAPRLAFELLRGDFEQILGALELHRQGFAPTLQGPLAGK